ncbi:hypothetical protein K0M31_013518, partial [Melipona bicolor]
LSRNSDLSELQQQQHGCRNERSVFAETSVQLPNFSPNIPELKKKKKKKKKEGENVGTKKAPRTQSANECRLVSQLILPYPSGQAAASLRTSKTEPLKEDGSISVGKPRTPPRSCYMTRIPRGFGMPATPDRRTPPPRQANSAVRRYQTTPSPTTPPLHRRPLPPSVDLCQPPIASTCTYT